MRPSSPRLAIVIAVVLAIVATLAPGDVAAAQGGWECSRPGSLGVYDQSAKWGATPTADAAGRIFPVITIHGITGSDGDFDGTVDKDMNGARPQPPRSLLQLLVGLPSVHAYSFSYTDDSLRWVTERRIQDRFQHVIRCLYEKFGQPVSVVAHSMGGLVTRLAANSPDLASKLGKVATLGTPYRGSLLSSVGGGTTRVAGAAVPVVSLLNQICGRKGTSTGNGSCGVIPLYSSATSEAGTALQVGSPQLAALAPWPSGPEVFTIAGSIRIPFQLFGSTLATSPDLGDFAVEVGSATADPGPGRVVECNHALGTDAPTWNNLGQILDPGKRLAKLALALRSSPCFHGNLMQSVSVTNEVMGQLTDWMAARPANSTGPTGPPCTKESVLAAIRAEDYGEEFVGIDTLACDGDYASAIPLSTAYCPPNACPVDGIFVYRWTDGVWRRVGGGSDEESCDGIDIDPDTRSTLMCPSVGTRYPTVIDWTRYTDGSSDSATFSTPSGNIGCALWTGEQPEVRCDIADRSFAPPERPASCDLDFGSALIVDDEAEAGFLCHGDTVLNSPHVLEYNSSLRFGPFVCDSAPSGVTCTSTYTGYGFTLSKAAYRLF